MTDLDKFPSAPSTFVDKQRRFRRHGTLYIPEREAVAGMGRQAGSRILRGSRIDILQMDTAGMATGHTTMSGIPSRRMRSLVQGPDGSLYVATDQGEIWQLASKP